MPLVCAWCDVYCREERCAIADDGTVMSSWTVCSYCRRSELRLSKRGKQTPPRDREAAAVNDE